MSQPLKSCLLILLTLCTFSHVTAQTREILQWRGEDRSGVYHETGLLTSWPPEGPALQWESVGIGNGYGSPVITRSNIFVNGEIDTVSYLFALDLQGKLQWKYP